MRRYEIRLTREAEKDIVRLSPKLREKLRRILAEVLAVDPYSGKKLVGDLTGYHSFRLTYQDRVVHTIDDPNATIIVHRARTHYGE
jgi:Txe/YoeB family toxin of Txe-Axe toxin-antitoxin module